jgi:hypothetical protein
MGGNLIADQYVPPRATQTISDIENGNIHMHGFNPQSNRKHSTKVTSKDKFSAHQSADNTPEKHTTRAR